MGAKRTRNDGAVASPRSPILILPSVLALLRRHHDTRCRTRNPGYEVGLVHRLTEWRQVRVKRTDCGGRCYQLDREGVEPVILKAGHGTTTSETGWAKKDVPETRLVSAARRYPLAS